MIDLVSYRMHPLQSLPRFEVCIAVHYTVTVYLQFLKFQGIVIAGSLELEVAGVKEVLIDQTCVTSCTVA